ncbi:uncharacterized protein YjdB [Chitinophaga sp. W2I13]|uniref:Ig-like domain-containing protein n=1 Tax=Chitinophaga sp. W2I13 TaxID=3373923 RepID=UPI003D2089F1
MKWSKPLFLSGLLTLGCNLLSIAQTYNWSAVRIGGGGLVSSVQAHPLVPSLRFITTDVGNPYRWNESTQRWEGLLNGLPAVYWPSSAGNLAFVPNDATGNILYVSMPKGTGSAGTIMKSTNRGTTWTDLNMPIWLDPNNVEEKRNGARLVVDPNNSNVVYVTTRFPASANETTNGTYRSVNGGSLFTKIDTLHGRFIVFDTSGGTLGGLTKRLYIANLNGVYVSNDAGASFSLMPGSPAGLRRGVLRGGGILYAAGNSKVYKWNGTAWSTITPPYSGSFTSVEVNPNNSNQIITNIDAFTGAMYKSNNGGSSWTPVKGTRDFSEVPFHGGNTIGNTIIDLAWDPFDSTQVWMADLLNAYQGTNIWSDASVWKVRAAGHEEVVVTGPLICPPSGNNLLLTVTADVAGFDHKSLTNPPAKAISDDFQYFNSQGVHMTGAAIQETNPNFIVRVGRRGWSGTGLGGYSTDGGLHYTQWVCPGGMTGGRVAVSATSETIIWTTQGGYTYRSVDRGNNWAKINSITTSAVGTFGVTGSIFTVPPDMNPLAADKVNGNKFYLYFFGKMMVSEDGGLTFVQKYANLPNVQNVAFVKVETTPGKEGDIWVSIEGNGLYHSTNSGADFTKITKVQSAKLMAIGKAAVNDPAIYVVGTVDSIPNSIFRSDNNGATWTVVANPAISVPRNLAADRRIYGRVFMGSAGNGIYTGETVAGPVTGITVSPATVSVAVGNRATLTAYVAPAWAGNKKVTWSSGDTTKVKVNDSTGVITGVAVTATPVLVTATSQDGSKTASASVTVTTPVAVSGIVITPNPDSIGVGSTVPLVTVITPANASNKTLRWTSSDTTIAKVAIDTPLVTGISHGTAVITATAQDSGYTSTATMIVYNVAPTALNITGTASVGAGDTVMLSAVFTPLNTSNKVLTWSSSDTTIAKVNNSGLVTAVAPGTVTITATTAKGGITGTKGITATKVITVVSAGVCGILPNNGFEGGLNNWMIVGDIINGLPPAAIVANKAHSGTKAAVISGEGGVSTTVLMPVAGRKAVTFSAWAKILDLPAWAGFGIDYIDSANHKITADQFSVTDTSSYKLFSVVRATPPNTARVNIWTYKASSAGKLYLDDFCVTVADVVDVTSLSIAPDPASVAMGYTKALTATILPANATIKTVTWTSSNTAIATVNASGVVTGVALGTATITATSTEGGKTATTTVTVTPPVAVTGVNVTPDSVTIGVADSYTLTATTTPANASNQNMAWTSSNPAIATVNATTGAVKAVAIGTAVIRGGTQEGSYKDSSIVTVISQGQCGQISNNGFESSLVGWSNINNAATITTDAHSGLKAVAVTGQGGVGRVPVFSFAAGDTIVFTAWAKVSGGPAWAGFSLDFQNASYVKLATAQSTVTATAYTEYTQSVVVPAGTANFNIWSSKSGAAGILYLDDFCLTVKPAGGGMLRTTNLMQTGHDASATKNGITVSAYPNPVQSDINIRLTNYNGSRIAATLTDMAGRVIHHEVIITQKGTTLYRLHNAKKPAKGLYILTLKGEGLVSSFKLLVQ